MKKQLHRRDFVSAGIVSSGAAVLMGLDVASAEEPAKAEAMGTIGDGSTILFQGDSITDAQRKRGINGANQHEALGNGYAFLAAAELLVDQPQAGYKIYNRGISGNKVYQLADRWQTDCIDLRPDVLSILIGVNDIWHHLNGQYDGTVEKYRDDYHALVQRTCEELPKTKLVICEPFVLRTGAVGDNWFPQFDEFRAAAKSVATEFDATWVPFQAMFDKAIEVAPPSQWAADGVHPTTAGAAMMAHEWLRVVRTV